VCVIEMLQKSEGIDAGKIPDEMQTDVPKDATFVSLRDQLGVHGGQLLAKVMRDMMDGRVYLVSSIRIPSNILTAASPRQTCSLKETIQMLLALLASLPKIRLLTFNV